MMSKVYYVSDDFWVESSGSDTVEISHNETHGESIEVPKEVVRTAAKNLEDEGEKSYE